MYVRDRDIRGKIWDTDYEEQIIKDIKQRADTLTIEYLRLAILNFGIWIIFIDTRSYLFVNVKFCSLRDFEKRSRRSLL